MKNSSVWTDARLGIVWREGRRPVVKATRAEDGRRRISIVERLVHGSPAASCLQLRPGDKLLSAESVTAQGSSLTRPLPALPELKGLMERAGPGCTVAFELLRAADTCHADLIAG
eukprot:CAMPEP_0172194888 /NCGR_PEP_ID=MMETSP1050-20130122/25868_1 /TAXON_ID=233186 /ORGANISM="Cryptomonas curvata, Strain CCAP979/52" /LENGTH=114 /DNA_ID=CAMNT_0012870821 /DNA_START=63 /DNA_END=403 /DNA_ORIENTATION=-